MRTIHRLVSAFVLVWQISRLSLPAILNKKQIGFGIIILSACAVGASIYLTAPYLLKSSEQAADEAVSRKLRELPDAPEAKPLLSPASVFGGTKPGGRLFDPVPMQSSFKLGFKGPIGQLPDQEPGRGGGAKAAPKELTVDPLQTGKRFPYPTPEKSPFEMARPGPVAQTPGQASAPTSTQRPVSPVSIEQEKAPNAAWIKGRDEQNYYLPFIKFGRNSATKIIYFVWGADEQSRTIFQSYLDPAIKNLIRNPRKNLKINMIQIVGSDEYGVADPGSMFFCATNSLDYAGIAIGYLRSGGDIKKIYKGTTSSTNALYFNEISELTLKSAGYIPEKCASDMAFFRQLAFAAVESTVLEKLIRSSNKPTLIYNGKPIDLQNSDALRRFGREVR